MQPVEFLGFNKFRVGKRELLIDRYFNINKTSLIVSLQNHRIGAIFMTIDTFWTLTKIDDQYYLI